MGAVRVAEVTGSVQLMRLHGAQQRNQLSDILLVHCSSRTIVKRQIQKVQPRFGHATHGARSDGFGAADERADQRWLRCRRSAAGQRLDERQMPRDIVSVHAAMAADLVRDVHLMAVISQAAERATHRDDVVIGMRREHQHALGMDIIVRARNVPRTAQMRRLAAGPTGDHRLQMAEYIPIDAFDPALVGFRPPRCYQVGQPVFFVMALSERQHRHLHDQGQVSDRLHRQRRRPIDRSDQPRMTLYRQLASRGWIEHQQDLRMILQEARRTGRIGRTLDRFRQRRSLRLAQRQQQDATGRTDRTDTHADATPWDIADAAKRLRRI